MQHVIPVESIGPQGAAMAEAVDKCVHCGFCLSACPTYRVLGEEMDSPRGRIYLMKEVLEGGLSYDETMPYVDRCLGCMACVTSCPSGVEYGHLLTPFRAMLEEQRTRDSSARMTRTLVKSTLPYPERFRMAVRTGKLTRGLHRLLPSSLRAMLDLVPADLPASPRLPEVIPAEGTRRARVALLAGCVQQVLAPEINWSTVLVLARNGVEVVIPRGQGCCGSLSMHIGEQAQARALARANLAAMPTDVDAIVTNAAGCGSGMREYPLLFAGEPEEAQATAFAARVRDISVFLVELGIQEPPCVKDIRIAYHDACHLAHAQHVTQEPRQLLASIPGVNLREIDEAELCCGSAGTYNLEQPDLARQIGARKAGNVIAAGADLVATGNIGCMTQLRTHLAAQGQPIPVLHTVQVLDRAYRGLPLIESAD